MKHYTWIKSTLMLGWGEQCDSWAFGRMLDANMTYSKHILSCYPCPQTTKHQYNCNISSYKHPILYWDRHCLAKSNFQKRIHLIYRHPLIMNLHCKYIKSREDKHSPLSSFTTHLLIEKILFLFKIFLIFSNADPEGYW